MGNILFFTTALAVLLVVCLHAKKRRRLAEVADVVRALSEVGITWVPRKDDRIVSCHIDPVAGRAIVETRSVDTLTKTTWEIARATKGGVL